MQLGFPRLSRRVLLGGDLREPFGNGEGLVGQPALLSRQGQTVVGVDGGEGQLAPRALRARARGRPQLARVTSLGAQAAGEVEGAARGHERARLVDPEGGREAGHSSARLRIGRGAEIGQGRGQLRKQRGPRLAEVLVRDLLLDLGLPIGRGLGEGGRHRLLDREHTLARRGRPERIVVEGAQRRRARVGRRLPARGHPRTHHAGRGQQTAQTAPCLHRFLLEFWSRGAVCATWRRRP